MDPSKDTRSQEDVRRLEDFSDLKKIGEGGFGVVFKARWNGHDSAIKCVKLTSLESEEVNEVKAHHTLIHENIVTFYSAWIQKLPEKYKLLLSTEKPKGNSKEDDKDSDWLCIQMELCDTDLHTYLENRETCDKTKAMCIFKDACDGLLHMHMSSFIHRDITTRNLFISSTGKVKVGDFGLAKYSRSRDKELQTHTQGVGAALSQSPDKRAGKTYETKSDVHSMGIILFALLYEMKTQSDIDDKLTKALLGELPDDFGGLERKLVGKMLSHPSHDRPTLTEVLQILQAEGFCGGSGDFSLTELVKNCPLDLLKETLTKCEKAEGGDELLRTNLAAAIHIQIGHHEQAEIFIDQVLQKNEWNIHALRNRRLLSLQNEPIENIHAELNTDEAQEAQVLKAKIEYSYCITMLGNQSYAKSIYSFENVFWNPGFAALDLDNRLLASWLYVKTLIRALLVESHDTHEFSPYKLISDTLFYLQVLQEQASDQFLLMQRWLWTAELLKNCEEEVWSTFQQYASESQQKELPTISYCLSEAEKHCNQTRSAKGFARLGKLYLQCLTDDGNQSREREYVKIESLLASALAIDVKNILALWTKANLYREKWLDSYIQEKTIFLNNKLEEAGGFFKDAKHYLQRKPVVDLSSSRNLFLTEQRSVLEKLLAVTPTNLPAKLQLAQVFFTQDEPFTVVERMFKDIIEKGEKYDPKISRDAYELWGLCCIEKGHLKKAKKLLFTVLRQSVGQRKVRLLAYQELNTILNEPKKQKSAAAYVNRYQGKGDIDDWCVRLLEINDSPRAFVAASLLFRKDLINDTQFVAICLYAARNYDTDKHRRTFSMKALHRCFRQNENVGILDLLIIHSEDRKFETHTSIRRMKKVFFIRAICQCQISSYHPQIEILFTNFQISSEWRDAWQHAGIRGIIDMCLNSLPLVVFYVSDDQFEDSPRLRAIKVEGEQKGIDECLRELAIDLSRAIFGVTPMEKMELIDFLRGRL